MAEKKLRLPPFIGSAPQGTYRGQKKMFTKSGVDVWCPHCKKVYKGPDEGKILDIPYDTTQPIGPISMNRHKTSIETCPDCLEHGASRFMPKGL